MNYKDSSPTIPAKSLDLSVACKLDSKARLVLPWKIRELLSVSYGDCVSIQTVGKHGDCVILKLKPFNPSGRFVKTSKNGWERR
ncbi:MAG: hypothetical protein V1717_00565 [Candidatus Micrarchaeota archaeon]